MKKTARPVSFASFRKKAEAAAKKEQAIQRKTDRSEEKKKKSGKSDGSGAMAPIHAGQVNSQ